MSRLFQTVGCLYGTACYISTPFILPDAIQHVYRDFNNTISQKDSVSAKGVAVAATFSIVPAIIVWSPLILGYTIERNGTKDT